MCTGRKIYTIDGPIYYTKARFTMATCHLKSVFGLFQFVKIGMAWTYIFV